MEKVDNFNNMKINILSKPENIAVIRVAISTLVANLKINLDELMDIKTAVSEAVTNVVEHAYNLEDGMIDVIVNINTLNEESTIEIIIKDYGIGIENIEQAMVATYTSKPELEHAGLGFTIMETFMDELYIDSTVDNGTTVKMIKKLRKTIKSSEN